MAIIKNYGLRWSREKVQWGSRGTPGELCGKLSNLKSSDLVDFREQIGIYVLYETNFVPVYVGQAGLGTAKLFNRLKNHTNDHLRDRWVHFSWFGFRGATADGGVSEKQHADARTTLQYSDALDEIEGILIQVLEPRLNRQGAKWQQTADEYVQAGLEDAGVRISDISEMLKDLDVKVEALSKKLSKL